MLKFPGVSNKNIYRTTRSIDKGSVIIGGIKYDNLVQSVELAESNAK